MGYQGVDEYNNKTWSHKDNPGPGQSLQHFGGYKPSDKDLQRGVGNAMGGQYNLARMMGEFGKNQFNLAGPAYGKALGFYQDLMGSAQSQRQALAPAIRNMTETGEGTRQSIRKNLGRSGAKEMALADAKRQTEGDINSMLAGAPMIGAEGAGRLAEGGLGRVLGSSQIGSGALGSMGAMGLASLEQERERKAQQRSFWGSLIGGGIGLAGKFFGL